MKFVFCLLLLLVAGCGAPVAPSARDKRGIGTWGFEGVTRALASTGVSWYYTWSPSPGSLVAPPGAAFVPMIWGASDVTASCLADAVASGGPLLGFNEPDEAAQSSLSVTEALDLWPRLEATGLRLGSPAVSSGGDVPGGWLDAFMSGVAARGYRVDFIAVHWYGLRRADLFTYLKAVHDRYHKPIWLTEFALADFTHGTVYAPRSDQAAFAAWAVPRLDRLSYVERYAWFALADSSTDTSSGLYDVHGNPTDVLNAYGGSFSPLPSAG